MSFAQNLKYIKEKENLTNYRLAKLFGCSQSSLINWLDNGVVPHPKTRQKIADHFGITLAELDGDELPVLPKKGAEKSTLDPKTEGVSPTVQELFDFIDTATDTELNELLRYAQFLMSKR
jgi:transcriptional regulator with XRE-family HTH domain|nr:MAG TPA: helix-turn-helix domain protein [Caudoviricetes sp.]